MTHLEKIQKEIVRVNNEINANTPELRASKEAFTAATLTGDPKIIADAKARLDALFVIRDKLKADRVALWADENYHRQAGLIQSGENQKEAQQNQ